MQGIVASDELVNAFWEMVVELKRADSGLEYTREGVQDMVFSMLNWRTVDLGFIRRVRHPPPMPPSDGPFSVFLLWKQIEVSTRVSVPCTQ